MKKASIRRLILSKILILFLIYSTAYFSLNLVVMKHFFIKREFSALSAIQEVQVRYIDSLLSRALDDTIYISRLKAAREMDAEQLKYSLSSYRGMNKSFDNIMILDGKGSLVFSLKGPEHGTKFPDKPFISGFIAYRKDNEPSILFSSPIYDYNNKIAGVAAASVKVRELQDTLFPGNRYKTAKSYLIDSNSGGMAALSKDAENTAAKPDSYTMSQISKGASGTGIYTDRRGKRVIGAFSRLNTNGYALVTKIDYAEAASGMRGTMLIFFIIFAAINIPVVISIFRSLHEKRYEPLNPTAGPSSATVVHNPIDTGYQSDINMLTASFNAMMSEMKAHSRRLEERISEVTSEKESLAILNKNLIRLSDKYQKAMSELYIKNNLLEESSKEKDIYYANISHELKTPLNIITSYLEYIEEEHDGTLTSQQKEYINIALESARRLKYAINNALEYSTLSYKKPNAAADSISVNDFLTGLLNERHLEIKSKGIELVYNPPENDAEIAVDFEKLRHIIANLIDNAIKFTDSGCISLSAVCSQESLEIVISDTGIGFDEKYSDKIFEPFFRSGAIDGSMYQGAGIGLSIVKQLTDALAGKIIAYNNPGKGSTFKVTLPINNKANEV